jgi:hypothetical protein
MGTDVGQVHLAGTHKLVGWRLGANGRDNVRGLLVLRESANLNWQELKLEV